MHANSLAGIAHAQFAEGLPFSILQSLSRELLHTYIYNAPVSLVFACQECVQFLLALIEKGPTIGHTLPLGARVL